MIRNSIFAAALLLATAGAAGAQVFHEANLAAHVPAGTGNVVGGGVARLLGGGSDSMVQRETTGQAQTGRAAQFGTAGGGEAEVVYLEPVPSGAPGRDAMLLGGGDDAVIIYLDTRPARRG